jgi:DedD protein
MREDRKGADGVELVLDNRQVFLLFFASAVILSLVFTLGVVVGKRVERRAAPSPPTDPLTLLDQMGGQDKADEDLTFHEALTGEKNGGPATAPQPEKTTEGEKGEPAPGPAPAEEKPAPAQEPSRSLAQRPAAAQPAKAKKPEKPALAKAVPAKVAKKHKDKQKPQSEPEPAEAAKSYSLQLSSFQDKHEAELFMKKLRDAGMKPFMVPTTIPGRGVWFRVRLGRYASWDEALAAKQEFERTQKIIAYVAKD